MCPNTCRFCTQSRKASKSIIKEICRNPTSQRYQCAHCAFIGDSISEVQKHQKQRHPNKERIAGTFKCATCDMVFRSTRSRASHQKGCKGKTKTPGEISEVLTTPYVDETEPKETIPHLLSCAALQASRNRHKVEYYLNKGGTRYLYSLKFLRWVHDLFQGELATHADVDNENLIGLEV
eukprot:Tbor_TRINITY_DN5989_c0_g2::TRINITY_DN5989_c0_g2_i1::g.19118::m.19118